MKTIGKYDSATFFTYARVAPFGGSIKSKQVQGCEAVIGAFCGFDQDVDDRWVAYGLATTYHETAGTMEPIAEYGKGKGRPYAKKGKHGQQQYGRGYPQLTWDYNYEKADKELGLGGALTSNYDLMLQPDISARVLAKGMIDGWFRGDSKGRHKLARYFKGAKADPVGARQIINGKRKKSDKYADKAELIATYYEQFLGALVAARKAAETGQRKPRVTERAAQPDNVPVIKSKSIWAGAVSLISGGGLSAFGGIDNPWAFATLASLLVVLGIGAYLILSGRIQLNRGPVK